MRLGLSSAAAPQASLDALLGACIRRGLGALELRASDGHGVSARSGGIGGAEARRFAEVARVRLTAFRSDHESTDVPTARLAAAAGAPVLVAGDALDARFERAAWLAASGEAAVGVVIDGDTPEAGLRLLLASDFRVAWDADPAAGDVGLAGERLLRLAGPSLRHIRIHGGGPEAALQEGQGIGALMARLALAGYDGSLVLSPGSSRYRVAWETWLGARGGWGCGSRASESSLVVLDRPAAAAAGGAA